MYFDGWALSAVKRERELCAVGAGSDCTVGGASEGGEIGVGVSAGIEEMRKWGLVTIVRERIGILNRGVVLDVDLRNE